MHQDNQIFWTLTDEGHEAIYTLCICQSSKSRTPYRFCCHEISVSIYEVLTYLNTENIQKDRHDIGSPWADIFKFYSNEDCFSFRFISTDNGAAVRFTSRFAPFLRSSRVTGTSQTVAKHGPPTRLILIFQDFKKRGKYQYYGHQVH